MEKEDDRLDQYIVEVPPSSDQQHFIVNFPGYVRDESRVLATFGGPNGLASQRSTHDKNLQLWLRPKDPCCHPLVSDDAKSSACIVLKLSRPRQGGSAARCDEDAVQVVATASKVYSFTSPADFQYVGRDSRPLSAQQRNPSTMGDVIEKSGGIHLRDADPEALPSQPLLCSPPAFTVESATDYGFKQYKASDHGIDSLGRKPKRSNNGLVGAKALIDYLTPEVPAAQTYPPPGAPLDIQTLAQRLSDLLQQRPVYLDGALEHALAAVSSTPTALGGGGVNSSDVAYNSPNTGQQQEILAKLCYRFRNGPWKGAWIRRGYDPRQHPDARQYQVLTYTLPADWYRKLAKHRQECAASSSARPHASLRDATTLPPLAQGYGALCQFCGVPSTSATQMQLCDIEDSQISTILADSNNICEASNDGSGWFRQATWEAVKARVAARFQSLLDAAEAALEASAAAADVPPHMNENRTEQDPRLPPPWPPRQNYHKTTQK